ncbi:hypothetical protein [Nocardia acidivorans]|uniref:hypothetical protein n=1 Tax=Nocardia acidivorans TaxID=404580 RepID=UPI00082F2B3B|nr:hypothetical protein [Nocardia acidivorans]
MTQQTSGLQKLKSDNVFWKWATITLPLAIALEAALFGAVVAAITDSDPTADPSRHLLFGIVSAAMGIATVMLWRRNTSPTRGAAFGVGGGLAFLVIFWLVTL